VEETIAAEALDYAVPPLLLQPLVENAVAHGISNLTEGGWIRLEVRNGEIGGTDLSDGGSAAAEELVIEVENNFDPEMPRWRGTGVGLANVRQRLAARYGERARFDVRAEGERFLVTLALPAEKTEGAA
jgi:sensor histidine kinase YesM